MFRSFSGFKAQCSDLTLVVVAEFNEWKVLVHGPGVAIMGGRLFDQTKARAQAEMIAESYLREVRQQEVSTAGLKWGPTITTTGWCSAEPRRRLRADSCAAPVSGIPEVRRARSGNSEPDGSVRLFWIPDTFQPVRDMVDGAVAL